MRKDEIDGLLASLFDLLVSQPAGVTISQIAQKLDLNYTDAKKLVRAFRMVFKDDTINLVCNPGMPFEEWPYTLEGTTEGVTPWEANRINDAETRLTTMQAVLTSVLRNADESTKDGLRAQIMHRCITRALEDLAWLRQQ